MVCMVRGDGGREGMTRCRLVVRGTVQGVGFRPHVHSLAVDRGLSGRVYNSSRGVIIEIQGCDSQVRSFREKLEKNPPRAARIDSITCEELAPSDHSGFEIIESRVQKEREALIPADLASCPECVEETLKEGERRHLYPFTNCTNCGPRFTIVEELPYDREKTSMHRFAMCDTCAREYSDPADRRFHAQPVACPECGPLCTLISGSGGFGGGNWLEATRKELLEGKIVAMKGLGGFHLACNAHSTEAVDRLRRRKGRGDKPFAVMARNLEVVKLYCEVSRREAEALTSPEAPIVVLTRRSDCSLPEQVAPSLVTLGVMLPYTPLHHLLLQSPLDLLIMTSGNTSGLPLIKDNSLAKKELDGIADSFLTHDRKILNRCDDSVLFFSDEKPTFVRRSRGYVPRPIEVDLPVEGPTVLGIGGEMKNTFCLINRGRAFMGQHIGNMGTVEAGDALREGIMRMERLLGCRHEIIGYDSHPNYSSSALAGELEAECRIPVQHHHAHLASCLAENGRKEQVIGVILDGTGYGEDETIWGFEVLVGDTQNFHRMYHLKKLPLVAGERSVRRPWRMAVIYLIHAMEKQGRSIAAEKYGNRGIEFKALLKQLESGFNSPPTSSCGRLFDAVSSILGLCHRNTYQGQAAVELSEMLMDRCPQDTLRPYSYAIREGELSVDEMICEIVRDYKRGRELVEIATGFHDTLLSAILDMVGRVRAKTGLKTVALSGGTWQNRYLLSGARRFFGEQGYTLLTQNKVPPNDGGLALGQAVTAYRRWSEGCV